ncbi:hypothetical protein MMC07_000899 [Pseudocyphellaria aurata]|nr:hypothetical protein [Pseudocyphellaria aurata]
MAGRKNATLPKRHLVRWSEELDRKLLLTIQYVCNADGIRIPWDRVGAVMGPGISDGAVVQHLAKLRQRMISLELSVPPPLRRGGGYAISTSGGTIGSSSSTLSKNRKNATGTRVTSSTTLVEENEEGSDEDNTTSVANFEKTRSKRVNQDSNNKRRNSKVKKGVSDEDEESVSDEEAANKSKPAVRARRSVQYNEMSECDSDDDEEIQSENAKHNIIEEDFVAARATFLRADSPYEAREAGRSDSILSLTPKKIVSNKSSKIVVLQVGNSKIAKDVCDGSLRMRENEAGLRIVSQVKHDEMKNGLSENKFKVNKATTNPKMVNKQAKHTAVAVEKHSRDGLHQLGGTFRDATAVPHPPQDMAHDLSYNTAYHSLDRLNSAPPATNGASLYADNSTMAGVQGGMYDFARHTSAGQNFAPGWIHEADEHSRSDRYHISSPQNVHRYSTAQFDSNSVPSYLYPQTLDVSGYNSPNDLQQSGGRNGNQHTMAFGENAMGSLHSSMASSMNHDRRDHDMPNQSMESQYQSNLVNRDLNHEPYFPATQQSMLSPFIRNAVPQFNGPSIPNELFSANNTSSGNYDLSPSDNMSVANFDLSQVHSGGPDHGDMQDGLGNGDEYSMMDAFDFTLFESDFGNESPLA